MCNNMASESLTASLSFGRTFSWVVFVCVTCFQTTIGYAPLLHVTCRTYLDLKGTAADVSDNQYDAGLLETQLPLVIGPFVREEDRCDITLGVPGGHGLMFYFVWLDYQDAEDPVKCSTASLQFFDGTPKQFVTGLHKPICGQMPQMPKSIYYVKNSLLRIRIEAKNKIQGRGFMIHFNVFRNDPPCHSEEFLCHTQGRPRCIAEHLLCDGWNDCGDDVDEDQRCNYLSDGGITVLVLGIFFLVAVIILIVVWCRKQKGRYWVAKEMKNMVEIRPSSLSNSREALEASFSVASETFEKEKYGAHTHHGHPAGNGRHSGRRSRSQTPTRYLDDDYHDHEVLPPYSEKSPMYREHSSYEDAAEGDGRPRRSRRRSRTRDSVEGVEEEEGGGGVVVRGRRRRSRSREDRFPSKEEEKGEGRYPDERDNTQPRRSQRRDDIRDSPRGAGDRRSGYDSRNNNDSSHDRHPDERRRHKPYDNDRYPPEDPRRREPYDERSPDDPRRKSFDERYPEESRLQHYAERYPVEEDRPRGPRPYNDRGYRSPEDRDSDSRHSRQSESYPNRYDDRDRDNYDRDRNRDGYNGRDRDHDRERDRYNRRDRDEDRYRERDSDRDRDTDTDRERERDTDRYYRDDRDRYRDEDRDRDSRRERPRSRREEKPEDRDTRRPEKDPHLHPRRDPQRRSPHVSDSDLDSSKDGRRASPKPTRDEERDSSSREDPYRAHNNARSADRRSRPQNEHPPNKHLPAPTHSSSSDQLSDSRPQSRHATPSDSHPPPENDNEQDTPSQRRRRRRDRASSGERLPGSEQPPEDQDTPRRRRRRSRSREGQERARASRPVEEEEDGGARERRGRQSRSGGLPAAEVGGYMEQSV